MSIRKKLLSWAIEIEDTVEDKNIQEAPSVPKTLPSFQSTIPQRVNQEVVETKDSKFKDYMSDLFNKSNLPGPDFFEFTKSKENIQQVTPSLDEPTMFKVAFASLTTAGLTKEKLLETSKHYVDIIEEDSKKFLASYEQSINSEVEEKLKLIKAKEDRLVQLTDEIREITSSISTTKQEIELNKSKLDTNLNEYLLVKQEMINKIQSDVQKINQFL